MSENDKPKLQSGDREEDRYHGKYPENSQYGLRNSDKDGRGEEGDPAARPGGRDKELPAEGLGKNEGAPTPAKPRQDGS